MFTRIHPQGATHLDLKKRIFSFSAQQLFHSLLLFSLLIKEWVNGKAFACLHAHKHSMCCHKYSVVCTRTLAQQQQPFGVDFWRPDLPESSSCWLQHCVSPSSARFTYAFSFFLCLSLLPHEKSLKKLEKTATGGAHQFHFAGNGVTFQNRWKEMGEIVAGPQLCQSRFHTRGSCH